MTQALPPTPFVFDMAAALDQHDHINDQTTRSFALAPAPSGVVDNLLDSMAAPSDEPPKCESTAEARTHWLDESLAVGAFFTVRQYPSELWQVSSFPHLSTCELVDRVLDKKGLHRAIALQVAASVVTHCVPAVANILHAVGHQCLCRPSVGTAATDVADWLSQQVGLAVPECQWHAGATPYARVNYLMVLAEEVFRTLPISWNEAVAWCEDSGVVRDALRCIVQAVRSARLEPQVMLGTWAAENMISNLQVPDQQEHPDSRSADRRHSGSPESLRTRENDSSTILSPPDSQHAACEGLWRPCIPIG